MRKPKFYAAEGSAIVQDTFLMIPNGDMTGKADSLIVYPAQQNRIQGYGLAQNINNAQPAQGSFLRYVFPETAAGTFKVRIKIQCLYASGPAKYWDPVLSNNTHMFPVKDMVLNTSSTAPGQLAWTWKTHSGNLNGIQNDVIQEYNGEVDIRVENPGGTGTINYIQFNEINNPDNVAYLFVQLEVVSYNNSFNYNGSGQIILIDQATDQIVSPITVIT